MLCFLVSFSDSNGWSEGSYFYVIVNDVEYLRGSLSGIPRKDLTLSCMILLFFCDI